MTPDELKARFPRASRAFLEANATEPSRPAFLQAGNTGPVAELERNPGNGALGSVQVQGPTPARFHIRLTSVRKRLLDDDNLCEKYHVDCCRYASLLPGDSPATTRIEVCQRKTEPGEGEKVIIEIFKR